MNGAQRRRAAEDVAWMIRQSGQTATIFRPQTAGADSFFGPREAAETEIGSIPIEMTEQDESDLTKMGANAVASVLPDCGVQEQDFLRIESTRYRVTEVKPQNLFGVVTHLVVYLEVERREASHG